MIDRPHIAGSIIAATIATTFYTHDALPLIFAGTIAVAHLINTAIFSWSADYNRKRELAKSLASGKTLHVKLNDDTIISDSGIVEIAEWFGHVGQLVTFTDPSAAQAWLNDNPAVEVV